MLKQTYDYVRKGQGSRAIANASSYKDPVRYFSPGSASSARTIQDQAGPGTIARGVRTSLGNTANSVQEVFGGGLKEAPKRFVNMVGKQFKADGFTELDFGKRKILTSKPPRSFDADTRGRTWGKRNQDPQATYVSSATGFRKVVGETNRNSAVVERSTAGKVLQMGLMGSNPVAMGGVTAVAVAGDKEKTKTRKALDIATTGTLAAFSTPAAIAHTIMVSKKRNQTKSSKENI
jgi:hypothetical protein